MTLPLLAILGGLALLVWSADRFVEGAAATSRHAGMPPLLIGMVIIGFGTSAPEMVVSAIAAHQGNPGLALGNAYGSNIANIALILGLTALLKPINIHSQVLRKELPLLSLVTLVALLQLPDGLITRLDAWILLGLFAGLMVWTILQGLRRREDPLATQVSEELEEAPPLALGRALTWLLVGLVLLILSSRVLVWGAVEVARGFGISDLIIGLTIVALGTSLPELASSIAAVRKNEHDLALGNVLGSNLFNTLAVVGIAGAIHPISAAPEVLTRDALTMAVLTLSLFLFGFGFRGPARLNRVEGGVLFASYFAYTAWLALSVLTPR